jgi:phage shock protein A
MITKRMYNLWRAMVGSGLTNLEADNAEAMLDLEREELHKKLYHYNRGLAGYAGLSERLKAEIARLDNERKQLEPKLRMRLEQGDRTAAGRHALRLETIASETAQLTTQLAETEATYKDLVRSREVALVAARDRLEGLKRSIGELKVQQALADLTELAAGMHGTLGVSDTLDRIKDRVDDKRNFAAGRARVARDSIDMTDVHAREAEQEVLCEAALERFERASSAVPAEGPAPQPRES